MVKLPDSSNLRRNIPQATSAIQSVPVAMDFQAMQGAGQQLQQTGNRIFAQQQRDALYEQRQQKELLRQQEKQDNEIKKFQIAQAKSQIGIGSKNILASLAEEQDFTKYPTILDNGFKSLKESAFKNAPDDPIARGYLELGYNEAYANAQLEVQKMQREKQGDAIRASVYNFGGDFVQQYATATPEQQKLLNSNLDFMVDSARGTGAIDAEQAEILRNKTRRDAQLNRIKSLTPEQVIAETGGYENNLKNLNIPQSEVTNLVFQTSEKYGVDPLLMIAIQQQENPKQIKGLKSTAGAIGEMQLMLETAQELAVDPYDTEQNIDGGVRYFSQKLKENNGDVELALASYNAGYGNVKKHGGIPPFKETQDYVKKIMQTYQKLKQSTTGQSQYSALPTAEIVKERGRAFKELRKQEIETKTAELTNALTSQTPNLKQQEVTLNAYDIDPEIKEKVSLQLYKTDNELKSDAIGFLEKKAMETGQDFDLETAIDVQKQRGIPESRASVLSKNDSQMVTQNLLAVKSVPEMEQWLGGLKQKVGDKYLPQAFRQLVKDGLPKEYKYVLALDPYKDADEMRVMFNGLTADKTEFNDAFKSKLLLSNEKKTDFDNNFNAGLESIIDQEIKKGTNNTQSLNDSLKLMAQSHFIQYGDSEKAIEFAKNSYMKNYYNNGGEFYTVDGTPLAIPIDATSDHRFIVDGLEAYKDNNINDIASIEGRFKEIEQSQKETVMDNAYFALNPQEDGVFLYDEMGLLILNKEKKPIELKFSELTAKREQNKKSLANIVAKEQAERQTRITEQEKIEANKPIELFGD